MAANSQVAQSVPLQALCVPALTTSYQEQSFTNCPFGSLSAEAVQCHEIYIYPLHTKPMAHQL